MNMTSASVPHGVDEFPDRRSDRRAVPAGQAAARQGEPGRARVQALEDHRAARRRARRQVHSYSVVFGQVVGIYIDDRFIKDGIVDTGAMRPIARLGYMDYAVVTPETMFPSTRPEVDGNGKVVPGSVKG